jgi:hypothetical protein
MGEFVVVSSLPTCDYCAEADGIERPARFDFKTASGPWANGCERHWRLHARYRGGPNHDEPELGTGKGQRLLLPGEDLVEGAKSGYPMTCPVCEGTGGGVYNDCPACDGNGIV